MPAFTANWAGPEIGNHGDTIYVVFKQTPETDSTKHIWLLRSTDGGQSFSMPSRVDFIGDSLSRFGAVTIDDNGQPIVSFMKFNSGFGEARYVVTRSNDYGNTFNVDTKASGYTGGEVCDCCPGTILNSNNRTVMLYRNNLGNIRTIWAGISNDTGKTFTTGLEIDNTNWMIMACPSSGPDGVIVGDTLYSVFRSSAGGTRVYFSKTVLSSPQLVTCSQMTSNFTGLNSQDFPRIAHSGNSAVAVWKQISNGGTRVVASFTNNIQGGFSGFDTVFTGGVTNVDVAMRDGEIHVVWENDNNGTVMYSKGTYGTSGMPQIPHPTYIDLYPNPTHDHFRVPLKDVAAIELIDISGKKIEVNAVTKGTSTEVVTTSVAKGSYIVIIRDRNERVYYSKIRIE